MHIRIVPSERLIWYCGRNDADGTFLVIPPEDFPPAPLGYTLNPARPIQFLWWDRDQGGLELPPLAPGLRNELHYLHRRACFWPYVRAFIKERNRLAADEVLFDAA